MAGEARQALDLIDRTERVLIVIERHLGVDHQRLATRHAHDRVGTKPTALAIRDADLGLEIGMFGQAAAFQHVAKLLLAPASPRLGSIAQRIDQLGRLPRDALLTDPHRLDLALQLAKGVTAFVLDLADPLFVPLKPLVHGVEQGLERLSR